MKSSLAAAALAIPLCLAAVPALAQSTGAPSGKWSVKWTDSSGIHREAYLDLGANEGTYKMVSVVQRGRPDPCNTVLAPVKVQKADETELVLAIERSRALAGCNDGRLTLHKSAEGYQGKFGNGVPVTVTAR